jgi:hypothetical protein
MRLPCASSPIHVLILAFFVPLLSLIVISAFSTLSSSLLTKPPGDSLTSTVSANTTANPASPSSNRIAMITQSPTKLSPVESDADSLSKSSSTSTTTSYHIPGSHTTTPLATMLSTPFPGLRCTETWRRATVLTGCGASPAAHTRMGISTGDVSARERESGSTAAAKEQCTATPTLKSWMARVREWCSDTGGHVL